MTCPNCNSPVTPGSKFCNQCGTSLAGLCPSCGTENGPDARFCSHCGTRLGSEESATSTSSASTRTSASTSSQTSSSGSTSSAASTEQLPYAERRQLTVLFSDLIGSTALSELLDPEDLRSILRDYQAACSRVMQKYEGYLAKYLGDGVLAYFGYPTAHEEDARHGVSAGLQIIREMKHLGERHRTQHGIDLDVRVGIHTGLVVVGDMDQSDALESNAIVGQTPNMAARIQSLADPNSLVISLDTYRLVKGYFETVDLGLHELKGISHPVHLFSVIDESSARNRLEAIAARLTPFSGRENETRQLRERWESARNGSGQIVLLGGEAGVGKSRLTLAMKEMASDEPNLWQIELGCSPFHQNSALYPVIDFLEHSILDFAREEGPEQRLEKIRNFAERYEVEHALATSLLASLLSVPTGNEQGPLNLTPQKQKEETNRLLLSIILNHAKDRPVLFILEDLHWADPSTLELLDQLIEGSENRQLLILLTYRPQFRPYWPARTNLMRLDLTGMPREDGEKLIRKAAGDRELPAEVIDHILTKTDGIPLFLEELTTTLIESKVLAERNGRLELTGRLDATGVPSTLQDSLTARLDRLSEAKQLAQLGSAVGREFTYDMVEAIPGPHRRNLSDALARLVDSGILYQKGSPPHATYIFKHALVQDAAYTSLLKSARRDYHKLIADAIRNHYPEMIETQPELIAHHSTEAERYTEAIEFWLKAGMRAVQRSANFEAIAHLDRGLQLTKKLNDQTERISMELQLLAMKGPALIATRGFAAEEVGATFGRAAEICEQLGDTPQLFPSLWGQWVYNLVRDELKTARGLAERMLDMGEETGDTGMLVEGHWTLGDTEFWMGNLEKGQENLEKAIELYNPEQHHINAYYYGQDPGVAARCYLLYVLLHTGDMKYADRIEKEMFEMAETFRHPFTKGWAICFPMMRRFWVDDPEEALKMSTETVTFCTEQSYPFWLFAGIVINGWAIARGGDIETGLQMIEQGLQGWNAIGSIICRAIFVAAYVEILMLADRDEEGLTQVDEAIALARKHNEVMSEIDLHRLRGLLLLKLDRHDEGLVELQHALDMAARYGSRTLELRASVSLAEVTDAGGLRDRLQELVDYFDDDCGIRARSQAIEILASA